jgi:O-antigen/teichoic acid export membrane protein
VTATPLRINAVANLTGQLWALALQLAMVPVYLRWMGLEAYGLIGIQITLLWAAAVLDVGLSGTINRELARAAVGSPAAARVRDLVRSFEWVVWPIALLIGAAGWVLSAPLAGQWLKPVTMTPADIALAITLMTAAIAAQWPAGFYGGALAGMNRQVLLNVLNMVFATTKSVGVLLPLWLVAPTATTFFAWQLAVGAVHTLVLAWVLWRLLPRDAAAARFRRSELARVGSFTGAVATIGLLSFVLMQADRIVLSAVLSLDQFGQYALAVAIGSAVHRLIVPMQAAVFPRFSQMVAMRQHEELVHLYHNSTQAVAVLAIPVVAVLAVFAEDVLRVWTGNADLASASGPVMAMLSVGYGLNGLMIVPLALQLAHGMTLPSMFMLALLAGLSVPATWLAAQSQAGLGAAGVWTALNCIYVAVGVPWVHARLMRGRTSAWLFRDIGPVVAASIAAVLLLRWLITVVPSGMAGAAVLVAVGGTVFAVAAAVAPYTRSLMFLRIRPQRRLDVAGK